MLRCDWDWLLILQLRRGAGNESEGQVMVMMVVLVVLVLILTLPHAQSCAKPIICIALMNCHSHPIKSRSFYIFISTLQNKLSVIKTK